MERKYYLFGEEKDLDEILEYLEQQLTCGVSRDFEPLGIDFEDIDMGY